ncbi:MAG: HAMP domain-containing protein, partial [Fibrobacteria bacterium]
MAKSGQGWHIQPKGSIQAKLLRSFAFQSAAVLALAFVSIMVLDWRRANLQLTEMENNIRAGLDAKGQNLSRNLSLVIRSLMEDNAIASIREIVDSLANQDSDIAYAAFMDAESRPWAFRSKVEYGRKADMREILSDSISIWASTSSMARSLKWRAAEGEIIEFAAPVYSGSESRGVVRVGLDTRSMRAALKEATEQVWQNRILTLGVFFAAAFSAFLLSLALSRLQAGRFTRPVLDLAASAKRIAGGDYSGEFSVRGEGEFALLAQVFETMRGKIQAYTHRLESLVAEKVRQIGDLLENVDQGLFTFNQDLNVNPDHSARAATVLRQENLAGRNLEEVLRMTPIQAGQFRDWVDVVFRDHARRRWSKLVMLAPMREMTLATEAGTQIIALDYRKILDADGRLGKIMVLAQDVTEKRALEMRLAEEKVRHESKVRI